MEQAPDSVKIFQSRKPAPKFQSEFLTCFASKIRRDPFLEITKSVMMTSSDFLSAILDFYTEYKMVAVWEELAVTR